MSVRAGRRARLAVVVGLVLVGAVLAGGHGAPSSVVPRSAGPALATTGACAGAELAHAYSGTVSIANSTFVPVGPLNYSYRANVATSINGAPPSSEACVPENGSVRPATDGAFNFSVLPSPEVACGPDLDGVQYCNTTTGPYVALNLSPAPPYPTGLEPRIEANGTSLTVVYVADLASVSVESASGSPPYSVGAVASFVADPESALGGPSPVAPTYAWTLAGAGWSFASPRDAAEANVSAAPGAGAGNLSVVASLATAAGTVVAPTVTVPLEALATTLGNGSVSRTAADVGQPIAIRANGTGAPGYDYTGTLTPGLGLPAVPAPCATTNVSGGPSDVICEVSYSYTAAGTASPRLTLTNGASAATVPLPNITVAPAPAVEIAPDPPRGYAGIPVSVEVGVAAGTGSAPFASGCLAAGAGAPLCRTSAGPTWTFAPVFADAGTYPVEAWVVDAAGANVSASGEITIADALTVALATPELPVSAGTPIPLAATLGGGQLPLRAWWNASGTSAPIAVENVTADGPISATFDPSAAGTADLTLTVVDALGARQVAAVSFPVLAGPATAIVAALDRPAPEAVAGTPIALSWQARDPAGAAVPTFASPAEVALSIAGANVPGWVNTSAGGALASPLVGWFDVPVDAWSNGSLNVTVAVPVAGTVAVALTLADGGPAPPAAIPLTVLPDAEHLRLFDPTVAVAAARAGATRWHVTDRFGNAVPGAELLVVTSVGGRNATDPAYAIAADGGSVVWVNYSAPGTGSGTVEVRDLAGDALLPPVTIPALGPTLPGPLALGVVVPALLVAAALAVAVRLRRRATGAPAPSAEAADDDPGLQRLAEGRAAAVAIVRDAAPIDLAGIAARWEPPPAPSELPDWVASLLTDGTLDARFDEDGVARFYLGPTDEGPPRVTVDLAEFDRAQQVRDAAMRDDDAP